MHPLKCHTHLYACHDGAHQVRDDEVVPQTNEPRLQFPCALVEGARHEHPGAQIHRVGVELVDEAVKMVQEVRDPVDQVLYQAIQRSVHTHTYTHTINSIDSNLKHKQLTEQQPSAGKSAS